MSLPTMAVRVLGIAGERAMIVIWMVGAFCFATGRRLLVVAGHWDEVPHP